MFPFIGTAWCFLMFIMWGVAYAGIHNPTSNHFLAAVMLWLITGPGAVYFYKLIGG